MRNRNELIGRQFLSPIKSNIHKEATKSVNCRAPAESSTNALEVNHISVQRKV